MKRPLYRDASLPISERVDDLLSRMNLAERAGQLFSQYDSYDLTVACQLPTLPSTYPSTEELVISKRMSHLSLLSSVIKAREAAQWHNRLQDLAMTKTRLGIPITLSTDPRNHFSENAGMGFGAGVFSQWPETLGFAALGDESLIKKYADISRQEYIAIGQRVALPPQIDLATEHRWPRISLTFGESAEISAKLGAAYIRGYERGLNDNIDKNHSVSCMAKHIPGGGPQKDGEDPHFIYSKEQVYLGDRFDYHLEPLRADITQGVCWMMPY